MIEKSFAVASFDVYPNSTLKPSALQRYMQQVAREDCDNLGCTYINMRDVNMVFVMTKLAISVEKPIFAYDELTLRTFNNRISGVTFEREFEFFKNGEKVIHATTQWVIVKYDDRSIVRPKLFPFEIPAHNLDCGSLNLPRNIVPDGEVEDCGTRVVRLSDLDENDHLNNCVYSDIALDFLPFDRKEDFVSGVKIIFRHEAVINDKLLVSVGKTENGFAVYADNSTKESPCFEAEYILGKIDC
jgi:acyl-ACP thioesterase